MVVISKDVIRRNILDTDFWPTLIDNNKDAEIALLVEGGKKEIFEKQIDAPNVKIYEYDRHSYYGFNRFAFFLIRTGINSHSTKLYRMRAWKRGQSSFKQLFVKEIIASTLANFDWYKKFVRGLVMKMDIPKVLEELFDEIKPDVIFVPSMIDNDFDVPVSVEAKKRGIRVIGMVRSWDNLNNHGMLAVVPDRFIVQNRWLIDMAEKFQAVPRGFIKKEDIVGLPHYDAYFDPSSVIKPREEFFREMNLDPNKKLILVGGSDFYYTENKLPETLNELVEGGLINEPVQFYFRPHPMSMFSVEDYHLDNLDNVILDGGSEDKKSFSDGDKLMNLFYHSEIIINICSTLSIDAAVFKTPAICINFDDIESSQSYWESVSRLYDSFDHYEKLIATGGVKLPDSKAQLAEDINSYLENPELDSEGRQEIIDEFVAPFDGKASQRLAEKVGEEL